MTTGTANPAPPHEPPFELVPRMAGQGYAGADVAARRRWVEARTGASLRYVGASVHRNPPARRER